MKCYIRRTISTIIPPHFPKRRATKQFETTVISPIPSSDRRGGTKRSEKDADDNTSQEVPFSSNQQSFGTHRDFITPQNRITLFGGGRGGGGRRSSSRECVATLNVPQHPSHNHNITSLLSPSYTATTTLSPFPFHP